MKKLPVFLLLLFFGSRVHSQCDLSVPFLSDVSQSEFVVGSVLINVAVQNTNLPLTSMTLRRLDLGGAATATIGARIYSYTAPTTSLLLAQTVTVNSLSNNMITIPVSFTMQANASYMVGFYIKTPNSTHWITMSHYNGAYYYDNTQQVKINSTLGSFYNQQDMFSPTGTLDFPYMSLNLNTTGINNNAAINDARIFPNPAKSNVEIVLPQVSDITQVDVVDLSGCLVKEDRIINSDHTTLDVSGLVAGVYIMKLKDKEGVRITKLVIEK